jgi:hypothetical protein
MLGKKSLGEHTCRAANKFDDAKRVARQRAFDERWV